MCADCKVPLVEAEPIGESHAEQEWRIIVNVAFLIIVGVAIISLFTGTKLLTYISVPLFIAALIAKYVIRNQRRP